MNKTLIAYTGNSPYCYSNSLHICLNEAGMANLPAPGFIECLTGMPFGATFLQLKAPLFFPHPTPIDPDTGVTRALEVLGWECELWCSEEADAASDKLGEALKRGPVLLGPLDMGFLSYDPNHQSKRGGDHYLVALKLQGEMVQMHDPQLFPFAVLPLGDVLRALYANDLGYAKHAYTLRFNFRAKQSNARSAMLEAALHHAQELIRAHPTGPVAYGGPRAFTMVADVLRHNPMNDFTDLLVQFSLPVGARRCIDAAGFLNEAGRVDAANLFVAKAEAFGKAQYYGVQQKWDQFAVLFDHLAQLEADLAAHL